MKKVIAIMLFCSAFSVARAQVIPTTATAPSSVTGINPVPSAYDASMKVNFIRTWEATRPFTVDTSVTSSLRTVQEVRQTTTYFDGLGRQIQTVNKQASPSGKDLVAPSIYDDFNREIFKYLSYVAIDSNTNTGKLKRNPFNEQAGFYSNATYNPGLVGEQVYYAKTAFESSPLNRADTTFGPGNSWGGSHVGVVTSSQVNTLTDSVRIWSIATAVGSNPTSTAYYASGLLYKNVTKDEHGKLVIEYKDKEGKAILKKTQLDNNPSSHHTGWLCTYYVYDGLNNLRSVIQPKGVELRNGDWSLSTDIINELCFRYEYDGRNRMIIKKGPGTGEVWMVYDEKDRLVMTQDSILRAAGKWLYTKYDDLNRPILIGLWTNSSNRIYHQGEATGSSNYPSPGSNYEILIETYYDKYDWVSGSGSGLSNSFISTYSANTSYFYSGSNTIFPYPQAIEANYSTMGMVTGTKTKILGTSDFLYSVTFYDDRGRVIQTHCTNQSGGKDTVTMQYSFSGQLLRNLLCHGKAGPNAQAYKILTKNEYDNGGRLVKISKKVGNSAETILTESSYDELGQLRKKQIGQVRNSNDPDSYTTDALDSLNYTFNILGWIRGINKDYARGTTSTGWFGTEITYDYGFTQTQLNGNIAGIRWRSKGDGEQRAYGFTYDAVSRFMRADFTQYSSSSWNTNAGVDFTVKNMSYDANGNILSMTQKGLKLTGSSVIDSLIYGYNSSSNKLHYVTDKTNDADTKLGDFNEATNNTSQDYWYDGNGNLLGDNNKTINSVTYNHLNLPVEIRVNGKGKITYTYDASGTKLSKTTIDSTASPVRITVTSYSGIFIYQNDTLQFAQTEEGRVRPQTPGNSDTMYYDYFEKDHLGNVRVMLTDELKRDMYPPASFETAQLPNERIYYSKVDSGRVQTSTISSYPADEYTDPNDYVQAVEGDGLKVGSGIVLKVMAGDRCEIRVSSFLPDASYPYETPVSPLTNLVSAFSGSVNNLAGHHPGGTELESSGLLISPLTSFLNTQSSYDDTRPKAFINWILFDEQFKFVASSSGFEQVGDKGDFILHNPKLTLTKNGYFYVYVSNESPDIPVFFDNLQVTHIRGPLLEENHYYPFGLVQRGISSKALSFGKPDNRNGYNGKESQVKEFLDGKGLEWIDYGARMYDQQIGRWHAMDNLSETFPRFSPYSYAGNMPTNAIDVDGNLFIFCNGFMKNQYKGGYNATIKEVTEYCCGGVPIEFREVPNPNRYLPDRGFYQDGPHNNGKAFTYWESVNDLYMMAYNDQNAYYTNGSFTPQSEASTRFDEGAKAGQDLIARLDAGTITLGANETIKIVGHSQGAAYAAGIASALIKNPKYAKLVEFAHYIAPHQPGEFTNAEGVQGHQFTSSSDQISSGKGFLGWILNTFNLNGRSSLDLIPGVIADNVHFKHDDKTKGTFGGHLIGSWFAYLLNYFRDQGIPINILE